MSKRMATLTTQVDRTKVYSLAEAVTLVKQTATAKFPETVELHVRLGVDPKQSDQHVRGNALLPHGTGKTRRVVVVAKGEKLKEAEASGADVSGGEDLVERIAKGWMEFDVLVATPDAMKDLSRLGKLLGPKGLMPNPKAGTVTFEIARAVKELKAGRIELKVDALSIIHCPIGKASFSAEQLAANAQAVLQTLLAAKPAAAKGQYLRSITVASTMGPGIRVDPTQKFA
ncbi:MAG: 50S ribosomal protein L1 [Elusimicrobia bacterium]|nr:50S ribosomal protein L1 [Elusimicrobiota bacterium]